ncbi:MAG: hypothetical protein EPO32_09945 [Anaerolineae bacterium]|nr:MAG: hypothetical protein EPO32_09945 [Anaerolineae bacterium]
MPISILIHIANEETILGEIEQLPGINDNLLIVNNPRKRDGKDIHYVEASVTTVIWPWVRINFIEILPSDEEEAIIGFVRE